MIAVISLRLGQYMHMMPCAEPFMSVSPLLSSCNARISDT